MHPEHAAFLRAVRAAPDDDLPRLIYADFLEERGDPRGEFIRAQVERARLPAGDPRRGELRRRERDLLAAHEDEWLGPLAAVVSRATFHRGFVDDVLVMAEAFLVHAETLFAWAPLRHVKLRGLPGYVRAVARRPELAGLASLDLGFNHLDARDARALADSPHLGRLRRLDLNGNYIGDEGVMALAGGGTGVLAGLEALHLENCHLSATAVNVLAGSRLTGLRALELSDNLLGDAGVRALLGAPFLKSFPALELTCTGMGDEGVAQLAAAPALRGLTRLRLGYNLIGDAGAAALATSPHLRGLAVLDLNGNAIRDAGAAALLAAPHLRDLERLELSVNPLSRDARRQLDEAFGERWG